MYNVYTHDQKLKNVKELKFREKILKANEQNRDALTAKYKDRMNSNLLRLNKDLEGLARPDRAQTAVSSQRTWLKSNGFLTEQERIKDSEVWNQWLDTTPSKKLVFKLRPREKSKEIQPIFKLKGKSGTERLEDTITRQKEYLDTSAPPLSKQRNLHRTFFGAEKQVITGGRQVYNYYHIKTHFKTIESLALDLHSSIRNMSRAEVKRKHNDEKLGMSENVARGEAAVQEELCKEDIMPISSGLLEKFGLWEARKPVVLKVDRRYSTPKWVISRIEAEKKRREGFE